MENDLDYMEVYYGISFVPTDIFSQAYCPWKHPELANISVGRGVGAAGAARPAKNPEVRWF